MKTRIGFVSNSSSSSFIVKAADNCRTVFDLARLMFGVRDFGYENDEIDEKGLRDLEEAGESPNTPVAFNSCNFETFIFPVTIEGELFFAVSTCNNHPWYELPVEQARNYNAVVAALAGNPEEKEEAGFSFGSSQAHYCSEDLGDIVEQGAKFIWLPTGVKGWHVDSRDTHQECNHCLPIFRQADGKLICVRCKAEATLKKR